MDLLPSLWNEVCLVSPTLTAQHKSRSNQITTLATPPQKPSERPPSRKSNPPERPPQAPSCKPNHSKRSQTPPPPQARSPHPKRNRTRRSTETHKERQDMCRIPSISLGFCPVPIPSSVLEAERELGKTRVKRLKPRSRESELPTKTPYPLGSPRPRLARPPKRGGAR